MEQGERAPISVEELERYSDLVLAKIDVAVKSGEPRNLVISDGNYSGELDYLMSDAYSYPGKLFSLFPPQDRSVLSPNPAYEEVGTYFGRLTYLDHLRDRLGIDREKLEYLHRVDARNEDTFHFYSSTSIPSVFYHIIGCEVPVSGPGWYGYFITVGLTEEQIKDLSKQAGAKFKKDPFRSYPNEHPKS